MLTVELTYDGKGKAHGDIVLPPLPPGKVYWQRPSYVNGAGKKYWVSASPYRPAPPVDRVAAQLVLRHQPGVRTLALKSDATWKLFLPGGRVKSLTMNMLTGLSEQTQPTGQGTATVNLNYRSYKLGIQIDNKPPPRSERLARIVRTIRTLSARLLVDGQGNVKLNQVNLNRVPAYAREDLLDLHGQIGDSLEAVALPVPNREVQPRDSWQTVRRVPISIGSGVEKAVLALKLTYEGMIVVNNRKLALVSIAGRVHGAKGRELRVGGRANGLARFDLEHGQFAQANLTVVAELDLNVEDTRFRVTGTLETRMTRDFAAGTSPTGQPQPTPTPVAKSPSTETPKATAANENLAGPVRMVDGAQVTELTLNAKGMARCLCWAPDGKAFYTLHQDAGVLRRVSYPGLQLEKSLAIGGKASTLALSAEGLVLAATGVGEVWLVDPVTLAVRKRVPVPGLLQVVSAPKLSEAVATVGNDPRREPEALTVLDLKAGTVGKVFRPREFRAPLPVGFAMPQFTPDGVYLFTSGFDQLLRFRLQGGNLVLEEASQRIGSNAAGIAISPDSKLVCLPSGGGNSLNVRGHPKVPTYSTYIYSVKALQTPQLAIHQGAYPRAVAFDVKAGKIYSQNFDHQLMVFSMQGVSERQFKLARRGESTWQLLPHPEGGRVLVLTDAKVYSVQLGS